MRALALLSLLAAASLPAADLDQRRPEGTADVYLNFAINCHDWLDPQMSGAAVLRCARLFAQYGLRGDFYVTEPLARAWAEKSPGAIEELKKLGMGFGYHHRPPHPMWFDSEQRRRMLSLPAEEAYREIERYETWRLNLETAGLDEPVRGGYQGTAELLGSKPLVLGAGAAPPSLVAWDREVLRRMGGRMAVVYHSAGDARYPLMWWQGVLARPSDFSVLRAPPSPRQRATGTQVLPRGVAAGEEAGNFWWNVAGDPEAQEHAPAKYLDRKVAESPRGRITFVTCMIHEDNWYKRGTSWAGTYYEDRERRLPRLPPYRPEPARVLQLRPEAEQNHIWKWWEELLAAAASNRRIRVLTAAVLLTLVREDDLERSYDRETVAAAARIISASTERLPEFVVLDREALSLADCMQAFSQTLAGRKRISVRPMLGPQRAAPAPAPAVALSRKEVIAAAAQLAGQLDEVRKPDALPSTVAVGGQEVALEAYLHAAAQAIAGGSPQIGVSPLRGPGPDPARWSVKPARRR